MKAKAKFKSTFPGGYFPLAKVWADTPEFWALSPRALKVLVVAMVLLGKENNGDIALTREALEKRGIRGERQRTHAIRELIAAGWLVRTRRGGLRMGPDLFAITVRPIDECIDRRSGKSRHELKPELVPSHLWRLANAHLREPTKPWKRCDGVPGHQAKLKGPHSG